jgi:hypothetical protein
MTVTVTLAGVRGGQGASTTAAALALLAARRTERVELVAHDIDTMAALMGVPTPADPERGVAITEQLTLRSAPSKTAQVVIIDAGPLQGLTTHPDGLLLAVLRGPCYLSLRAAITGPAPTVDGIIVVREHGRSLTERDVTDVTGTATLAESVASPAVARTIDAGVLAARVQRLSASHHSTTGSRGPWTTSPHHPRTHSRRASPSAHAPRDPRLPGSTQTGRLR